MHRLIAALAAGALLAGPGCGRPKATPPPVSNPGPSATPSPTPTPSRPAPALVQIENAPDSLPHSGIQAADTIFEYLTEGDIARLTAVYPSPAGTTKVEPVRSVRLITLKLQAAYGGVIFY